MTSGGTPLRTRKPLARGNVVFAILAFGLVGAATTLMALRATLLADSRAAVREEIHPPARVPAGASADELEAWLARRERALTDLRPGTEKIVRWNDPQTRTRTALAVVYVHGFSGSRQETAPLAERIADELGANLFATRLRGHGRSGAALAGASVRDWLEDTAEAVAIGHRLGDAVVLVGTSTGGTLATWAATRPELHHDLAAVVLLSPNHGPRDRRAEILTWPGGLALAKRVEGPIRTWTPQNHEQALWWTTSYPLEAVATMMRVVDAVNGLDASKVTPPVLLLHGAHDQVVRTEVSLRIFARFAHPSNRSVRIEDVGDVEGHVLAGDVLSPSTTEAVAAEITEFVRALALTP